MENRENNLMHSEDSFDIRKFLITIFRNWYWFAISIFVTYSTAFLINRYTPSKYSVSSTLIINDERKSTAEILINALDRFNARRNIENEIAILRSLSMARKTLLELPDFEISYYIVGSVMESMLYRPTPFKVILDTLSANIKGYPINITVLSKTEYEVEINGRYNIKKKVKFGEPFISDNFNFTIINPKGNYENLASPIKYYFIINSFNSLANSYRGKLSITTNDKKGTVLTLTTTGLVPQMEADYLNKLMEVYIQSGLEDKNRTAINTINFIDEQLSTVVDSLRRAEDKLQDFRLSNKIIDISSEGQSLIARLEKIQSEKASLELQIRYFNYLLNYIVKKKDFREVVAPSVMGINEPLLNEKVAELAKLYGERYVMNLSAQNNNPSIALINAKIQSSINALTENVNEMINATSISMSEVEKRLVTLETSIKQLPITERKLLNIERDFKLNDQIYNFLLQRRADAAIAKASNVADNKILDVASAENAVLITPKTSRNKMIAFVIGILIPLVVLILIEFFNEKIIDPKDIEKYTKVPIYGSIGHNEKESDIPVFDNPKSAIAESFRALRTNLYYIMHEKDSKVICVSSTISGEGKTFCAVNLASIFAKSDKKVLLLSLDLRKPKVHKIFDIENVTGLSTYLIGKTEYKDIIIKTNIDNLFITPAGPVPPNPAELIETAKMDEFIKRTREEFDIIVMDTPPIAIVTDAILLTKFAQAVIFVVRQNYSTHDVLELVDSLHFKRGIKNIGILVNDVKVSSYYGYGRKYSYGYGYGYGYYYGYGEEYYGEQERKRTAIEKVIKFLFKS
jgi:capsular exopolysaccharide synthesis family protein